MIFVPVGILQGPKKIIYQGRGGGGGVLEYYTVTELQSLLGDQVSFIVNQQSSEQGRVE